MLQHIKDNLKEAHDALTQLMENTQTLQNIEKAGELCYLNVSKTKGHVYSCGNGGSMCDAMHFAEELSGRFRKDRPALGAIAMGDGAHITCSGNDFGFDYIFSRFVEAQGRTGDVLVGISTSGRSKNVIEAAKKAKELGLKVVILTGKAGSELGKLS